MGISSACGAEVKDSRGNVVWRSETDTNSAAAFAEQYLANLLGERPPTLESYRLYEGRLELEEFYEDVFCRMRWGSLTASECDKWVVDRRSQPDRAPSVYYAALRAHLPFVGSTQRCRMTATPPTPLTEPDFRVGPVEAQQWVFLCKDDGGAVVLEVRYAATESSADVFLLHLKSVNGLPLSTIVAAPCDGLGMDRNEFCLLLEPAISNKHEVPKRTPGTNE